MSGTAGWTALQLVGLVAMKSGRVCVAVVELIMPQRDRDSTSDGGVDNRIHQ